MSVISAGTAQQYGWGEGCDAWPLVSDPSLSVKQERMPPGAAEIRHHHQIARQFFYVLRGQLTLDIDGKRHQLGGQAGIEVGPGLPHQAINESDAVVEFLVISSPATDDDRIEA